MPYNTRRKSLSLSSLGIHVPVTNAARAAANRPPALGDNNSNANGGSSDRCHPNKKMKRCHSDDLQAPTTRNNLAKECNAANFHHTPPPSPKVESPGEKDNTNSPAVKKIDFDGINDEIVVAVIFQLQRTDNRPHLVKELAAVLTQQVKIVQQ